MWFNQQPVSNHLSNIEFPGIGQEWSSLQSAAERLKVVSGDMKLVVAKKKENQQHESRQIKLLQEELGGSSLLSHYVTSSDERSISTLLTLIKHKDTKGSFVNYLNSKDGSTALLLAIQKSDKILNLILEFPGVDVNKASKSWVTTLGYSKSWVTPLAYSITQNDFSKFKLLLERKDIKVNNPSSGIKPLITASRLGEEYHKFTFELLKHGALLETSEFKQVFTTTFLEYKCDGKTPIGIMVSQGRLEEVKYLVQQDCDIDAISGGKTLILLAASNNQLDIVLFFLEKGAVVAEEDFDQIFTEQLFSYEEESKPVWISLIEQERWGEVEYIIKNLDIINEEYEDESIIVKLANAQRWDLVLECLDKKAILEDQEYQLVFQGSLLDKTSKSGKTALGMMIEQQEESEVKYILSKEVDVDSKSEGVSPVLLAAKKAMWPAVFSLLNKGAKLEESDYSIVFSNQLNSNLVSVEGVTFLGMMSSQGRVNEVKYLLSRTDVSIDKEFGNGQTAIWMAACNNCTEIVVELLEAGAIVRPVEYSDIFTSNILEEAGDRILKIQCKKGDVEALKYISRSDEIDLSDISKYLDSPSLESKDLDIILVLLSNGAKVKEVDYSKIFTLSVVHRVYDNKTVLGAMCEHGNLSAVKHIMSLEISPNVNLLHNGKKPILISAENNHDFITLELLEKGAIVKESEYEKVFTESLLKTSHIGKTALGIMSERGDVEAVKYLLDSDAQIDTLSGGEKPLIIAAKNGKWEVVLEILKYRSEITKIEYEVVFNRSALNILDGNGKNMFMLMLLQGDQGAIDYLCEQQMGYFNVNHKNNAGDSIIHMALNLRDINIFNKVIGLSGIDLNLENKDAITPLMLAARMEDQFEAMKYVIPLLKAGANFNRDQLTEFSEPNEVVNLLNLFLDLDGYDDNDRNQKLYSEELRVMDIYPEICQIASFRYGLKYLLQTEGYYTDVPKFSLVISPNFEQQKVFVIAAKYSKEEFITCSYHVDFDGPCKSILLKLQEGIVGSIIPSSILSSAQEVFQKFAKSTLKVKGSDWNSNSADKVFVKPWVVKIKEQDVKLVDNTELDKKLVVTDINFEPKDSGEAKKLSEISYDGNNLEFVGDAVGKVSDENVAKLLLLGEVCGYEVTLVGADAIMEF